MSESQTLLQRLSQLIAIDSQSSKDNTPVIKLIQTWFPGYEQTIQEWVREDGVKGKNLIVKIPGETTTSSLVFVCHMDTVPPSKAWETDPFILESIEGKLYGLGTCDTKGGTAALIEAVLTLKKKPSKDVYLVFNGDEEASNMGAKKLHKSSTFPNPEFIFVEPTEKEVLILERGLVHLDIVTHGVAQHGSLATPENSEKSNAINKMVKVMNALVADIQQLQNESHELLGSHTQNFGHITGGTATNVIADTCTLSFDRRLLPQRDALSEADRLKKLITNIDEKVEIVRTETLPSFSLSKDAHLATTALAALQATYKNAKYGGFIAWSEAGLFADKGDVLILGPGSLAGQAHRANEYVEAKEVLEYVEIYRKIIETI